MASLLRTCLRSPVASSSSGPSLVRTMVLDNSLIIPSNTTYHVTNPGRRASRASRKREVGVVLREDHPKLGSKGDVVSVNKTHAQDLYRLNIAAPIAPAGGSPQPTVPLPYAPTSRELLHTPEASVFLSRALPSLWPLLRGVPEDEGRRSISSGPGDERTARRMVFDGGLPLGWEMRKIIEARERKNKEIERRRVEGELEREMEEMRKVEERMERMGLRWEEETEGEEKVERT